MRERKGVSYGGREKGREDNLREREREQGKGGGKEREEGKGKKNN